MGRKEQPIVISGIDIAVLTNLINKFENKSDYDKLLKILKNRQSDEEYDNLIAALSQTDNIEEFRNFADLLIATNL